MTTIARLTPEQAYLLKGRLEAEQIPAFVLDEHANTGAPLLGDSFAGLRVQVPDEHLPRAEAIVAAIRDSPPSVIESESFVSRPKPILEAVSWIYLLFLVLLLATILYLLFRR